MQVSTFELDNPALNKGLLAVIEAEKKRTTRADGRPMVELGPSGAWCSDKTLLDKEDQAIQEFVALIEEALFKVTGSKEWFVSGWANWIDKEGKVDAHNHEWSSQQKGERNTWAGIYYVQAPDGDTISFTEEQSFKPKDGLLLIFDAMHEHWVSAHAKSKPRVSIGFNVKAKPLPMTPEGG